MTATAAVDATGLVKTFGRLRAVDGIDLHVRQGEIFGVLGPNGAGKTTALRMLATLLPIDAGQARVFGVDVAREPRRVRQLIGTTGQYASVDEDLTATENLWMFGRLQGLRSADARAAAKRLLAQFDLQEAADKPIAQFSGGMRRRLDLAASLITRPPLIFLDEPTTGLDPRTRGQCFRSRRRLRDRSGGSVSTITTAGPASVGSAPLRTVDPAAAVARTRPRTTITEIVSQTLIMAWRALKKMRRNPEQFFDVTLQPLLFTAMFAYIFGGVITGNVHTYLPLLIPGIVAQTVLTTCMSTGVQLREDMEKGVFDRFKALPMARIAPLAGPMVADLVRYLIAAGLTFVMGVIIGYRPGGGVLGVLGVLGAIVLAIFTGWALAWIFTFIGTIAKSARAVQGISFLFLFPLTFLSNAFVPVTTLPGWLQAFVKVNPVSHLVSGPQPGEQARCGFLGRGRDPLPSHRGDHAVIGEPVGQGEQPQRILRRRGPAQQAPRPQGEQHQPRCRVVEVRVIGGHDPHRARTADAEQRLPVRDVVACRVASMRTQRHRFTEQHPRFPSGAGDSWQLNLAHPDRALPVHR
jgi:ABC-2 type transport system permease protein